MSKSPALARLSAAQSSASNLPAKEQKRRINSLKQELELTLRELAAPAVGQVLQKALEMALMGDRRMIELILNLHMSKPQAQEDTTGGRSGINIQINNLTKKPAKPVEVIDVTSESDSSGLDRNSEEHAEIDSVGSEAGKHDGNQ